MKPQLCELKVDWDGYFDEYLAKVRMPLDQLSFANIKFVVGKTKVFRTKHGFHVYYYYINRGKPMVVSGVICLWECLLYSDTKKQVYTYIEGDDILFSKKDGYVAKYDKERTAQLKTLMKKIYGASHKITSYDVDIDVK